MPLPTVLAVRHDAGGRDQRAHVQVVPAHVADRDVVSGGILGVHLARVRQAGLLLHRQRIELGAQQHGVAGAVLQHRHQSRTAHVLGDLVAECAQLLRQLGRGLGSCPESSGC